jgi:hypothetical protein
MQANSAQRNKAQLTRVCDNGEPTSPFTNIGIDDAQEMQVLQDKCQHLAQVLSLDCEVLRLLPRHLAKLANGQAVNDRLQSLSSEGMIQANRIKMLLKRLDGTIELVSVMYHCIHESDPWLTTVRLGLYSIFAVLPVFSITVA